MSFLVVAVVVMSMIIVTVVVMAMIIVTVLVISVTMMSVTFKRFEILDLLECHQATRSVSNASEVLCSRLHIEL